MLTPRWDPLRWHAKQQAYFHSTKRWNMIPAGRRSGKTELAKRKLAVRALIGTGYDDARFFAAAPTRDQAKRIFWQDLKKLIPNDFKSGRPSESELVIRLVTGAEIHVVGLDKPERIEGSPWDGGVITEMGNVKPQAWGENIRPALSDRQGWCDREGVPEGRNHYYDMWKAGLADIAANGNDSIYGCWTWPSEDILPPEEIEQAMRDLDELTFEQEYRASFVSFLGRAYYGFQEETHCARLGYDPRAPLIFAFDFNVDPGVCAIIQEQVAPGAGEGSTPITAVIGEVHIPRNSNTPAVCRKLVLDWGEHDGRVLCYGDATGGNRGTAKVKGSDWDLIEAELRPTFGKRLGFRVRRSNPNERPRIASVNSRLKSMSGDIRLLVDPAKAPNTVKDFEGVQLLVGGSGEIDKQGNLLLSHLSDGIGYYIFEEFPVIKATATKLALVGGNAGR